MYIEASRKKPNSTAELIGPTVTASTTSVCVTFWSHMYGMHIGTLNFYNGYSGKFYFRQFHLLRKLH